MLCLIGSIASASSLMLCLMLGFFSPPAIFGASWRGHLWHPYFVVPWQLWMLPLPFLASNQHSRWLITLHRIKYQSKQHVKAVSPLPDFSNSRAHSVQENSPSPAVMEQSFHREAVTICIDSICRNLIVSWVKTQAFCKAHATVTQNNVKLE